MNICVIYNFPTEQHGPDHQLLACRFVGSVLNCPPGIDHTTIVVSSGGPPSGQARALFSVLPKVQFIETDDVGWDIGNFIRAANQIDCDMMFCCGGPCYFRRPGWLNRVAAIWQKYGPGFYGTLATFEVRPHINTTGFACPPWLLRQYPKKVVTREDRYEFEHGENACYIQAQQKGLPVFLITWNGIYPPAQFRQA